MTMHYKLAIETIKQQSTAFYDDVIAAVGTYKDLVEETTTSKSSLFREYAQNLAQIVKKYTNLNTSFVGVRGPDFAIVPPVIDHNTALTNPERSVMWRELKGYLQDYDSIPGMKTMAGEAAKDYEKALKEFLNKKESMGTIDFKKCKVDGVFTELLGIVFVPFDNITYECFTAEELAAPILHEIGHYFYYLASLDRRVFVNMVLTNTVRFLDASDTPEAKTMIIQKARTALEINDSKITKEDEKLARTSTDNIVKVLYTDTCVERKSQIGPIILNCRSFEQLADDFALRHGCSVALASFLDKLIYWNDHEDHPGGRFRRVERVDGTVKLLSVEGVLFMGAGVALSLIFTPIAATVLSKALIMAGFGLGLPTLFNLSQALNYYKQEYNFTYDNLRDRMIKVKQGTVQRLKECNLNKDEKAQLLANIEVMDNLINQYVTEKSGLTKFFEKYISSMKSKKSSYEFQRDCEEFANNDLFVKTELLKNLRI